MTLGETIKETLAKHLREGGVILGQNLGDTGESVCVPSGALDLPTSDASNAATTVGHALAGKRVVYVIRYAPFGWINLWPLVNYAAKSWSLWKTKCSVFIRAIASEGGIGPVASGPIHHLPLSTPGIKVFAPMTPAEWTEAWGEWQAEGGVVFCSEHRLGYKWTDSYCPSMRLPGSKANIVGIGWARFNAGQAAATARCNFFQVHKLKPLAFPPYCVKSAFELPTLVVDSGPTICGAAEHVALELHKRTGARVEALGLDDRVAGFAPHCDVLTPSAERIAAKVREMMN